VNIHSLLYNAQGSSLTWGSGNKTLSTGTAGFRLHLLPASASFSRSPFGANSSWQATCDRGIVIKPGDFLLVDTWGGFDYVPPRRFRVDGVADYPHSYGILDHINLALTEHKQN
jgi:hypothetical protein